MTISLVLGLFAGLYMIWLLFTLAAYALPVGAGIALSLWMRDQDYGYLAAILGGFAGGVAIQVIGQILFVSIRSPIIRLAITVLFAVPASIAGYHAVQGLAGLAIEDGVLLSILSCIGAVSVGSAAWMRLAGLDPAAVSSDPGPTRVGAP